MRSLKLQTGDFCISNCFEVSETAIEVYMQMITESICNVTSESGEIVLYWNEQPTFVNFRGMPCGGTPVVRDSNVESKHTAKSSR